MEIDQLHGMKKTIGAKQTQKAIARGEVTYVFLANDSDERVVSPVRTLCDEYGIPYDAVHTMEALGKACRIKVRATAVGLLR